MIVLMYGHKGRFRRCICSSFRTVESVNLKHANSNRSVFSDCFINGVNGPGPYTYTYTCWLIVFPWYS